MRLLSSLSCLCVAVLSAPAEDASAFWAAYQTQVPTWPVLPAHTPSFHVVNASVPFTGSNGSYQVLMYELRDAATPNDGIVAVYVPYPSENTQHYKPGADPELNLLVPLPSLVPAVLPALPRYGWAWLYGAKVVTIPWLDCCSVTGDSAGFAFSPDFSPTLTLTQRQAWVPSGSTPGRDAQSVHNFTLRYDTVVGYRIDVAASMRINNAAAPRSLEFLNMLSPHLANPWPVQNSPTTLGGPRSTVTAWTLNGARGSWRGFAENLLSGAMLGQYNISANATENSAGAVVLAAPGGYSAALAHGSSIGEGASMYLQATCPTWMDQHQFVSFPSPLPAGGYVTVAPTFSLAYLPPAASDAILSSVQVITHVSDGTRGNGSAVMIKIGVLEDFSQQPVALTEPLRALVTVRYNPDYKLVDAGAGRGQALSVAPVPNPSDFYAFSNMQPLIPLNASTAYLGRAAALPPYSSACPGSVARLVVMLFEDDDFNTQNDRLLLYSSINATGSQWQALNLSFTSPPWPSYADVRFETYEGLPACTDKTPALFDNFFFGRAEDAPRFTE